MPPGYGHGSNSMKQARQSMDIFSGDWEIDVDFIGGRARHVVHLVQTGAMVSGRYRSQFGEYEIAGRADGEDIDLRVDIHFQGVGATYRLTGRASGDRIEGEADLGEYWKARWSGRRI